MRLALIGIIAAAPAWSGCAASRGPVGVRVYQNETTTLVDGAGQTAEASLAAAAVFLESHGCEIVFRDAGAIEVRAPYWEDCRLRVICTPRRLGSGTERFSKPYDAIELTVAATGRYSPMPAKHPTWQGAQQTCDELEQLRCRLIEHLRASADTPHSGPTAR